MKFFLLQFFDLLPIIGKFLLQFPISELHRGQAELVHLFGKSFAFSVQVQAEVILSALLVNITPVALRSAVILMPSRGVSCSAHKVTALHFLPLVTPSASVALAVSIKINRPQPNELAEGGV